MNASEVKFFRQGIERLTQGETFPEEFEKKYKILFESYPDPVFLVSSEGTILDCNGSLSTVTGYSREELCGVEAVDIIGMDIPEGISASACRETEEMTSVRGMCRRKDGSFLPVSITAKYLDTEERQVFVFLHALISIHAQSKVDIQSRHARKLETIGTMAGGVSHYFNNIFTGIMGNISLAQLDAPQSILPLLERVEKAAGRASEYNRKLLSFSRKSSIHRDIVDIGAIIDDVEHFIRVTFDNQIEIKVTKHEPLYKIPADASSIHHVLLNLCVNARDALYEARRRFGDISILTISIEAKNMAAAVPGAKERDYVAVSVSDTGIGMDREIQQRVFEPFFTTKDKDEGTGLGLSTAFETIKEHDGWFEVFSTQGKGSLFRFYIPAVNSNENKGSESPAKILHEGTETVLLVDDEEMIRTFGKLILERLGYTVLTASNGREGLDLFLREKYRIQLVILDLVMPLLSGKEVFHRIHRIDPGMKVILSSGKDSELESEITNLHVEDFLVKPFNIYDLSLAVRKALDSKCEV